MYLHQSRSEATWRAYESDCRQYLAYCQSIELPALPLQKHTVMAFLSDMAAQRKSPSTIQRRLTAIQFVNKAAGHVFPEDEEITALMKGIRRNWRRPKNKKAAAVAKDIMAMADTVKPQTHIGLRDRAVLLFGFAGAFRRSELVSIHIQDLEFKQDKAGNDIGVEVTIPVSKTDQEAEGQVVAIPIEPGSPYCPVQALRDWITVADITSGPIFLRMRKGDRIGASPMSAQSVALIVKEHAMRAGFEPAHYAGHSLRRGFLTSAAEDEKNIHKMAAHSRHKSFDVLREYIENQQKFKDHAGAGLLIAPETDNVQE